MIQTIKRLRGFTVIELLIVVVVIGILVTVSVVAYSGVQRNARDKSILSDLDSLDGLETQYGLKNGVAGKAWYSGDGIDTDLNFTPSSENVIDVVVNSTDYCIRGYNQSGTKNSIINSFSKGSSDTVCGILGPSLLASGVTGSVDGSLLGWWRFNGNAMDSSNGASNGTIVGATLTAGQGGVANTAYYFSGQGQYISFPAVHNTSAGSVSLWFQSNGVQPASASGWFIFSGPQSSDASRIYFNLDNTGTAFTGRLGNGTTIGTAVFNTTNWYNILITWSGTNASLYIDGTDITSTNNFNGLTSTGANIYVGCISSSGLECINGKIDDLRVYSRALTAQEASDIYDSGAW